MKRNNNLPVMAKLKDLNKGDKYIWNRRQYEIIERSEGNGIVSAVEYPNFSGGIFYKRINRSTQFGINCQMLVEVIEPGKKGGEK